MPLRGIGARDYGWCLVCQEDLLASERLTAHLQGRHNLDLIPGCPECCYYRARAGDIDKHCSRMHQLSRVTKGRGQAGCAWGLVARRATYKDLTAEEVVAYPRSEESLSPRQVTFLAKYRREQPRGRGDLPAEGPSSPVAGSSGQNVEAARAKRRRRDDKVPSSPR